MAIGCQLSSQLIVLSSFLIYQVSYSICFYAESKWDKVGNVERLQRNPKAKKKKKQRVSDKIFDSYGLLLSGQTLTTIILFARSCLFKIYRSGWKVKLQYFIWKSPVQPVTHNRTTCVGLPMISFIR